MLKRAFRPFDTHRSYKAKKSAVAAVEVVAVVAGGGGLGDVPFRMTSAQEGESETGEHCGTSCCRLCGDPAGAPAPITLPASGGSEPDRIFLIYFNILTIESARYPFSYNREHQSSWY
jgi:hypothetical protein